MSRECEPCRLHFPESPSVCPRCGAATKFTLLLPLNETPEPIADVPEQTKFGHNDAIRLGYEKGVLGQIQENVGFKPAMWGIFAFVVLTVVGTWLSIGDDFARRAATLKVGMPIRDVSAVMGYADPSSGSGEVTWEGGDKAVRVVYRDGKVTELHPDVARGGLFARRIR